VGPGAGLDAEAGRKILCPCRGSNPDRPARSRLLYCLSYRGFFIMCMHPSIILKPVVDVRKTDNVFFNLLVSQTSVIMPLSVQSPYYYSRYDCDKREKLSCRQVEDENLTELNCTAHDFNFYQNDDQFYLINTVLNIYRSKLKYIL
jgi:hypothetical protein